MKHLDKEFRAYLEHMDILSPEEIDRATPNEIFDTILTYEGLGMYAGYAIRRWVNLIYDCDLDDLSLNTFMNKQGDYV